MTRIEKQVAQRISDSISQQAALLKVLGFDVSDIFDTLRDINEALINMETEEDMFPMPTFEEHIARETVYAGSLGDTP